MKNTIKTIKTILFVTIIFFTFLETPLVVLAQTDSTEDQQIEVILNDIEDERIAALEAQILLTLPTISDNPNHVITFTDPSNKGVYLEVDGGDYKKIENPYTLPTLGIGQHTLNFKFTDNEQMIQILERTFVVIPRVPQIKAPDINSQSLAIGGTGIALGSIELFMTNGTQTFNKETAIDKNGIWAYTFEDELSDGRYTVVALARKNGFASKYSEPVVFEIDIDGSSSTSSTSTIAILDSIRFKFSSIDSFEEVTQIVQDNPDLLILVLSVILLGFTIGFATSNSVKSDETKKAEKLLKNALTTKLTTSRQETETKNKKVVESQELEETTEKIEDNKPLSLIEKLKKTKEKQEEKTIINDQLSINNDEEISSFAEAWEDREEIKEGEVKKEKKGLFSFLGNMGKKKDKKQEVKEDSKEEVLSKEEFLEKFNKYDPDDNKGHEKGKKIRPSEKEIKTIKTEDVKREKIEKANKKFTSTKKLESKKVETKKKDKDESPDKPSRNIRITLTSK